MSPKTFTEEEVGEILKASWNAIEPILAQEADKEFTSMLEAFSNEPSLFKNAKQGDRFVDSMRNEWTYDEADNVLRVHYLSINLRLKEPLVVPFYCNGSSVAGAPLNVRLVYPL